MQPTDDRGCPWCGAAMDDETIGDLDANLEAHAVEDPCEGMKAEGIGA